MSPSQLSQQQILQNVHNPADGSLKVDAEVTAVIGEVEVSIDSIDDSITIGDSSGNKATVSGGALNVNASNPSVGVLVANAPTSATLLGAEDSFGKLQALTVDPSGKLLVDITGTSTVTGTVNASIEGLTAFQTSQYSISTSATQIASTPLVNRSSMGVKAIATGSNVVYIGNSSSVTAVNGYPLFNGDALQLDLTGAQQMWAISTASGQTLCVLEIA